VADVKGDLSVKNKLDVRKNAKFFKGVDQPYFEIIDQKNPAVLGGTNTPQQFVARDLTVVIHNDFATATTLAAVAGDGGDFTLPAGDYYVEASAPAFNVGNHIARLADVTSSPSATAPTVVLGTTEFCPNAPSTAPVGDESSQTRSKVTGRFQLAQSAKLELQHLTEHQSNFDGFGAGAGFYTVDNVYSTVRIWQLRDDS
jgi:hypothetical protein